MFNLLIFISVFANDEGTLNENSLVMKFIADYLYFFIFPLFPIMSILNKVGLSKILYIVISCLIISFIYTYLTIRIYQYFKLRSTKKELNKC